MSDAMTTAVPTPQEPDGAPRLPVIDILRGIAILGILFMNINDMGASLYRSQSGEPWDLGWSGADQIAWWLRQVLADGTARAMLEMLFGVGMVILTDRAATAMSKWQVMRAYQVRNVVLFLFGLVHVFILLWPGDILHTYGLAALLAVLFRRWRPRWLLVAGLAGAMLQLTIGGFFTIQSIDRRAAAAQVESKQRAGQAITAADRKTLADRRRRLAERDKGRAETAAKVAAEDKWRTAGTATVRTWIWAAWEPFIWLQKQFLEVLFVWEALGTMLIGAALFKLGIIQGARSRRFYAGMTVAAYAVGLSCRAWTAYVMTHYAHQPSLAYPTGEVARLATTLGHIGLVNLLIATGVGARLLRPFEAAGKTALSIYIGHTLVCLWVLYPPWGLALYGKQGWAALMLTAVAVDAALLIGANWWVRNYRIAPVEWAWRSIIARRALPFRLRERVGQGGGVAVPA